MSGKDTRSRALFDRAVRVIPGGVNSPVRAFRGVGGVPRFIRSASGSRITDADGNTLVDYVGSWGPMLFGHAPPFVLEAVREAAGAGTSFGAPTEREVELAELVCSMVPGVEMVRFVNSGSEATGAAVRLVRGYTGRPIILKCEGCYHGSVDALLARAGSGVATLGIPDSAGVPDAVAAGTMVVPFNDTNALEEVFAAHGNRIAAFIVEPVAGNMGLVPPRPGYLEMARALTRGHGALLVLDEVMTGFRLGVGGAGALLGILPDLVTLGKIVGGGLPVAAYGGRRDVMECVAPLGPVYQAGTLSGNPLAMAAGLAMLREIRRRGPELYELLEAKAGALCHGLSAILDGRAVVQRFGSMFTVFFSGSPVTDFLSAKGCDTVAFSRFFHGLLGRGVYFPPSQFESAFVSAAHTDDDISLTLNAAREIAADI